MDNAIPIAVVILHLLILADIWFCHLTRPAKVLWSLTVLFLFGVGPLAWLLTRHSAYQPLEEFPGEPLDGAPLT